MTNWHPEGGCWISNYSTGSHGYAQIGWNENGVRHVTVAHRVSWWAANQEVIGKGMTVDHICRRRPCINPLHLRLIPNSENASDNGMSAFRTNQEVGRSCRKGHPLVAQSTDGRAYCRTCKAERKRLARKKF